MTNDYKSRAMRNLEGNSLFYHDVAQNKVCYMEYHFIQEGAYIITNSMQKISSLALLVPLVKKWNLKVHSILICSFHLCIGL